MARQKDQERGRRIKDLRIGMRLSQEEFASRFAVTRGAVVGWEKGAEPSIGEYEALRRLGLEVPGADIFDNARQLALPFDQTFIVELRIGPQRAGSVDVRMQLKERAN
jgi:transcriptional regulator with XRE-family HTH domain